MGMAGVGEQWGSDDGIAAAASAVVLDCCCCLDAVTLALALTLATTLDLTLTLTVPLAVAVAPAVAVTLALSIATRRCRAAGTRVSDEATTWSPRRGDALPGSPRREHRATPVTRPAPGRRRERGCPAGANRCETRRCLGLRSPGQRRGLAWMVSMWGPG